MVVENTTKNANFIRIVTILRNLRDNGSITEQEYLRAKKYLPEAHRRGYCTGWIIKTTKNPWNSETWVPRNKPYQAFSL